MLAVGSNTGGHAMTNIKDTDLLAINREGIDYQISALDLKAAIKQDPPDDGAPGVDPDPELDSSTIFYPIGFDHPDGEHISGGTEKPYYVSYYGYYYDEDYMFIGNVPQDKDFGVGSVIYGYRWDDPETVVHTYTVKSIATDYGDGSYEINTSPEVDVMFAGLLRIDWPSKP